MIDTIVLTIPISQFKILNHDAFNPNTEPLVKAPYYKLKNGYLRCDYIQSSRISSYQPRVSIWKKARNGCFSIFLRIEFSAPKLVYGNNFLELTDSHFQTVCEMLYEEVNSMGVAIDSVDTIKNAPVSAIHYSKNFVLENNQTTFAIINAIKKTNISKIYDICEKEYRNEGYAFKYRTNQFEAIFYDKRKDLETSVLDKKNVTI